MKKTILPFGTTLLRSELRTIHGGNPPCFEWCADPALQAIYNKPYGCSCSSGGSGGSNGGDPL